MGLGWVKSIFLDLRRVGLGQSVDGLGWVGSPKMDPRTTLRRCSVSEKVTVDLALQRLCFWDSVVRLYSPAGLKAFENGMSTCVRYSMTMAPFTFSIFLARNAEGRGANPQLVEKNLCQSLVTEKFGLGSASVIVRVSWAIKCPQKLWAYWGSLQRPRPLAGGKRGLLPLTKNPTLRSRPLGPPIAFWEIKHSKVTWITCVLQWWCSNTQNAQNFQSLIYKYVSNSCHEHYQHKTCIISALVTSSR